jgi:hypothetical protein
MYTPQRYALTLELQYLFLAPLFLFFKFLGLGFRGSTWDGLFYTRNQAAMFGSLAQIILYSKLPALYGGHLHPTLEYAPS